MKKILIPDVDVSTLLATVSLLVIFALPWVTPLAFMQSSAYAQTKSVPEGNSYGGSKQLTWSATALGVNAITLPISGTTALSNIVNAAAIQQFTLEAVCTQTWSINVAVYEDDGATVHATLPVLTAITANTKVQLFVGSEIAHSATSGTTGSAIRLPQKAVAFSFANGTASAGTCTARLIAAY